MKNRFYMGFITAVILLLPLLVIPQANAYDAPKIPVENKLALAKAAKEDSLIVKETEPFIEENVPEEETEMPEQEAEE